MGNSKLGIAAVAIAAIAVIHAKADAWNQETIFTFNEPVAIPGQVLPPGTYTFKLLNTQADRDIVEVLGANDHHFYGVFPTIPDYRHKAHGTAIVRFDEAPAGSPEAIQAWFYPGDSYGHEFVYPRKDARELAKTTHEPVPSMPDDLTGDTTKPAKTVNDSSVSAFRNAKLMAEKPNGEEVTVTTIFERPANTQ